MSRSWKWVWLAVAGTIVMVMLAMMTSFSGARESNERSRYFERSETCQLDDPMRICNAKLTVPRSEWVVRGRQIVVGLDLATQSEDAGDTEGVMTDLDFLLPIEAGNIDALRMRGMDIASSTDASSKTRTQEVDFLSRAISRRGSI